MTVHSGVPYCEHGIVRLDSWHTLEHQSVSDVRSYAGRSVWMRDSVRAAMADEPTSITPELVGAR